MKQRFNALDIKAAIIELKQTLVGCRVSNIYDIDSKTYLIKLAKPDKKSVILIESGIRIHQTDFDWPKNVIPSGFSMKMRKHLRSRRLEDVNQIGADRIVDLQFGSGDAAYHLIVELYDRGNILLTDFEYTIISVLRPRTDENSDVRFNVREKYPLELARQKENLTVEKLKDMITNKENEELKKILTFNLTFGAPLIEHCLALGNFGDKTIIGKNFNPNDDLQKLFDVLVVGESIADKISNEISKGYIIQKTTKSIKLDSDKKIESDEIITFDEFHPFLFKKYENSLHVEYETFNKAVDEFYSQIESQKLEIKHLNQNKEAIKKLENVKKDHQKRIEELKISQSEDELKATLITYNLDLVDKAIYLVNSAIANKLDWKEINDIIDEAREENHEIACIIKRLKLEINHIVLDLEISDEDAQIRKDVEIDLALNAFKNSTKYFESKKSSYMKEKKTLDASDKALKSAEKKTFELLKQSSSKKNEITKSRKLYWFEKFYWFITSENYLVIGGRDQQQNETIVKKYLKNGDIYVHADIQGASSVVVKNPSNKPIPPKTINEAGCMAVCYSVAWEAKVLTNAYWVYNHQVSKQAPTGEYLSTGSFMIRGKKNFIPQTALVFGFGILYKLDDESIQRHKNDRMVKLNEDDDDKNPAIDDEDVEVEVEIDEKDEEEEQEENEQTATADSNTNENLFPDTSFKLKLPAKIDNQNTQADKAKKEIEENDDEKEEQLTERIKSVAISNEGSEHDDDEDDDDDDNDNEQQQQQSSSKQPDENESMGKIAINENKKEKNKPGSGGKQPAHGGKKQEQSNNQSQFKRGQKAKYNKIKNKYKDQDDEDRELIMKYLASSGKSKNEEKEKEKSSKSSSAKSNVKGKKPDPKVKPTADVQGQENLPSTSETNQETKITKQPVEDVSDGEEEGQENVEDEIGIIDSLTGIPLEEDEILFCVPVCAPYTTLNTYKHKVKMIPGTTKKGQAFKTAIQIFMRDKNTHDREKDLIKTYLVSKEQEITRNLPGKVKISAPNLMKIKKK